MGPKSQVAAIQRRTLGLFVLSPSTAGMSSIDSPMDGMLARAKDIWLARLAAMDLEGY